MVLVGWMQGTEQKCVALMTQLTITSNLIVNVVGVSHAQGQVSLTVQPSGPHSFVSFLLFHYVHTHIFTLLTFSPSCMETTPESSFTSRIHQLASRQDTPAKNPTTEPKLFIHPDHAFPTSCWSVGGMSIIRERQLACTALMEKSRQ